MENGRPLTKVFVVDDDDAVRDSLKVLLEVHGIEVEDYGSTGEFASRYQKPERGVLILDQHLPVLTGVDFLNSPAGRQLGIPVILITGRGDPAIEDQARQAGAEYLQKPVSERVLLAAVERLTADARPEASPKRHGRAMTRPPTTCGSPGPARG